MITRRELVLALVLSPLVPRAGSAEAVPDQSPEALLRFVYGHYVGKGRNAKPFTWNRKPLVDALFEPALARAVIQDSATGEVGRVDFDPFVDAQDFKVATYKLESGAKSADRARLLASFTNLGERKRVRFEVVRTGGRWQIRDIAWGSDRPSLRKMLGVR